MEKPRVLVKEAEGIFFAARDQSGDRNLYQYQPNINLTAGIRKLSIIVNERGGGGLVNAKMQ